jgi:hypothetical protein
MTGDRQRGQSAEKRLQGVALLAMARLESTRTTSSLEAGRTAARVVLILFFLAASVALLLYAGR